MKSVILNKCFISRTPSLLCIVGQVPQFVKMYFLYNPNLRSKILSVHLTLRLYKWNQISPPNLALFVHSQEFQTRKDPFGFYDFKSSRWGPFLQVKPVLFALEAQQDGNAIIKIRLIKNNVDVQIVF